MQDRIGTGLKSCGDHKGFPDTQLYFLRYNVMWQQARLRARGRFESARTTKKPKRRRRCALPAHFILRFRFSQFMSNNADAAPGSSMRPQSQPLYRTAVGSFAGDLIRVAESSVAVKNTIK